MSISPLGDSRHPCGLGPVCRADPLFPSDGNLLHFYNYPPLPLNRRGVDVAFWHFKLLVLPGAVEIILSCSWNTLSSPGWLLRASWSCWGSVLNSGAIMYSSVLYLDFPSALAASAWPTEYFTTKLSTYPVYVWQYCWASTGNQGMNTKHKWIKVESILLLIPVNYR